jgi:hypothetical protein
MDLTKRKRRYYLLPSGRLILKYLLDHDKACVTNRKLRERAVAIVTITPK